MRMFIIHIFFLSCRVVYSLVCFFFQDHHTHPALRAGIEFEVLKNCVALFGCVGNFTTAQPLRLVAKQ